MLLRLLLATIIVWPSAAFSQAPPKLDSLIIQIPVRKEEAADRVVTAFTAAGLSVTNSTPSVIESDQGSTRDQLIDISRHRMVRATLLPRGDSTAVMLRATEEIQSKGRTQRTVKLSNRSNGNGRIVWRRLVSAAAALDSAGVPAFADPGPEVPAKATPGAHRP